LPDNEGRAHILRIHARRFVSHRFPCIYLGLTTLSLA
jgi:hypothetical protein